MPSTFFVTAATHYNIIIYAYISVKGRSSPFLDNPHPKFLSFCIHRAAVCLILNFFAPSVFVYKMWTPGRISHICVGHLQLCSCCRYKILSSLSFCWTASHSGGAIWCRCYAHERDQYSVYTPGPYKILWPSVHYLNSVMLL